MLGAWNDIRGAVSISLQDAGLLTLDRIQFCSTPVTVKPYSTFDLPLVQMMKVKCQWDVSGALKAQCTVCLAKRMCNSLLFHLSWMGSTK